MKRQGRYWSEVGAEAMVRVIDSLRNNELDTWLNEEPQALVDEAEQAQLWKQAQRFAHKKAPLEAHEGVLEGRLGNVGPISTPIGQLNKRLNQLSSN